MSKPKKRRSFYFTPELEKLFNLVTIPGTNTNSNVTVGENARKAGVEALNFLNQEAARKDAEIEARSDRKTVKRLTTIDERLRGEHGYSSYMGAGTPMSGRDPALGTIFDWTVGAKGIDALGKTALWNYAKYVPTSELGRWGRNYFINLAFRLELRKPILFGFGTELTPNNLFRTKVYKGGEITDPHSNFVTTDPRYAANYGKVTPYLFESKSIAHTTEPMMGYKDPVNMDMFVYNNTKHNPGTTAIMGHDAVTGEFTPSRGIEILNLNPKNLYPIETSEPSTSLAFFERKPSKISLAERLGIPKGDRGNLSLFLKDALEDLEQYINSGLYRLLPTINMETAEPSWVPRRSAVSALRLLIDDGVPNSGRNSWAWNRPNGGTYELVTDGNGNFGIGYNSYRMFDISPEFNVRVGEASAGSAKHGYSKIFLTAPKNDARHFITETPEQELAKKTLIETQSPRINKDIMRDFWSGVLLSLRPGAYLSGDEGMLPKGATLIRQFKELLSKGYRRDNNGNIIGSGRTNWEDIRNSLMRSEKWKRREDGLSTDSYLALLKQANRENSPYYLRYSPDGFTTFNSQSIDNKFISDLLEKTKTGEATQLEFLDAFHNWISPYGGMDAKIVNGEIVIPHPFLYKKKQGGKMNILQFLKNGSGIHIKKKNRGKFTDYCGGKVTDDCIRRAKASGNPTLVKRATFADNTRKWKHKNGGILFAQEGATFGLKVNNFLNSDTGKFAINLGSTLANSVLKTINDSKLKLKLLDWKNAYVNAVTPEDFSSLIEAEEAQKQSGNPDYNSSPIEMRHRAYELEQQALAKAKQLRALEADLYIALMLLNNQSSNEGGFSSLLSQGLGLVGLYLSNKTPNTDITTKTDVTPTKDYIFNKDLRDKVNNKFASNFYNWTYTEKGDS